MDDFDLDRSTAGAWTGFAARLAEVLSVMDDTGDLTISSELTGEGAPLLQFSSPRVGLVRGEVTGLPTVDPVAGPAMTSLGWNPCGNRVDTWWREESQEESELLAGCAVATLRDVHGVPHPVFLRPDQLAEVLRGTPPEEAPVLLGRVHDATTGLPVPHSARAQLDALVDAELTDLYGHPPVRDADGDVAIRVGSTMLFLRTSLDGCEVTVFAAVVHDITGRSRAAEVLNDLNVEARWVKFQLVRDRVFVTLSVLARPFVGEHLRQAVQILSATADGIDEALAAKLHGRTTFSDRDGA